MPTPDTSHLSRTAAYETSAPEPLPRSFAWRLWSERAVLMFLILLFVKTGFIPAWNHLNSDFPNSYLVARLYREGYPLERVYDWTWFQRQKDHRGIDQGLVGFIPQTIPSAMVIAPWSSLPPLQAKRGWLAVNIVFLLLIAALLTISTRLGWLRVSLLMFLAVIPLRSNFLLGQLHVFVLLLLTFAAWLYFKDQFFLCGLVLAVAATAKIYPALFLIFFLFKKQWRAAVGLVVGLCSAAAASLYFFGTDTFLLYVREVLPRALKAETTDPYNVAWNSFSALFRRLFILEPELNPVPVAHLPWLYALLNPLVQSFIFVLFMWAISSQKRDGDKTKLEWATYLFLLLFLSSQPGSYHFVALILGAVLAVDYLVAHKQNTLAAFTVLIYALICGPLIHLPRVSPIGWQNLLFFSRLALMTVFGGVLLWIFSRSRESLRAHFSSHFTSKGWIVAVSTLVVLLVAGFISTERHLGGQFENYKTRVVAIPGDLFASNPVVTSDGVLFTGMTREGYAIRRLRAGSTRDFPRTDGDWLHPTASESSDSGWAEEASEDGSRVIRFAIGSPGLNAVTTTLDTENAEEPVVSRDGQVLAFLRPVNGRNSLWVRTVSKALGAIKVTKAREIAGAEYDVREASFFPNHRLIFSSRRAGRFSLYMSTESGQIEELKRPTCSARYPAISLDGHWIAFSCEQGGGWQLHVMDVEGKQQLQLSTAECNSISPAWTSDSKRLIYATDCGRGLGLTALSEITVFH
jgi:hypothetical protein